MSKKTTLPIDFDQITLDQRIGLLSGVVLFISTFLPWYQRTVVPASTVLERQVTITNGYNDITYLIGVICALLAIKTIVIYIFNILKKPLSIITDTNRPIIVTSIGSQALLLLIVAISIYSTYGAIFTPALEYNTRQQAGISWGMLIALAATLGIILAGLMKIDKLKKTFTKK